MLRPVLLLVESQKDVQLRAQDVRCTYYDAAHRSRLQGSATMLYHATDLLVLGMRVPRNGGLQTHIAC